MDNETEKIINTYAYIAIIIAEIIFIYVINNEDKLTNEESNNLVFLARTILLIVAIYFLINAFIGLNENNNKSQYKQVIASIFALIAAFTRFTIKSDDIEFR